MAKNALDVGALILLVVGGLNWGLIGLLGFNIVSVLFGSGVISRIIYTLVGLSALYVIYFLFKE